MHGYASDNFFRGPKVYFAFGVFSVASASGFSTLVAMQKWATYFDEVALSAGVIYGGLVFIYEQWCWHWLSTIKNLNGTWIGSIKTSHDGSATVRCVMRVRQTWTRMAIELETEQSRSRTTMAALYQEQSGDVGLKYEYVSEPKHLAAQTMQIHRGVCTLTIDTDSKKTQLAGDYFTGRGRETCGEITLYRVSRKRLSFDKAITMAGKS